ncbi:MAG: ABC transporter permease [Desulfobacterales bacterium]|nr:ABC transporter permease [Desulfobacterales bacterium]
MLIHKARLYLIVQALQTLVTHRHLLREFVSKEVKGRFAGTFGGAFWTLINPLVNIIAYLFIFSLVLKVEVTAKETGTDRFALFFLAGYFPWLMFSESVSRCAGVLIDNANLITKVIFPVELLPASSVISVYIVNGIGLILFLIYILFLKFFHISWLFLIVLLFFLLLLGMGLGYLCAGACVFIRDIKELMNIIMLLWFYATPIIYPLSMAPDFLETVIKMNPMCTYVQLFRDVILLHRIDWMAASQVFGLSLLIYGIGAWFFMRAKPGFGDVL